jgi:hypothetical protein
MSRSNEELDRIMNRAKANLDNRQSPNVGRQEQQITREVAELHAALESHAQDLTFQIEQKTSEVTSEIRQKTSELTNDVKNLVLLVGQVGRGANKAVLKIITEFDDVRQDLSTLKLELTETQTQNAKLEKRMAELEVRLIEERRMLAAEPQSRAVN